MKSLTHFISESLNKQGDTTNESDSSDEEMDESMERFISRNNKDDD